MATQTATGSRNSAAAAGINGKTAVGSSGPSIGRKPEQPLVGKQNANGGKSMPGSKGKGQMVKTVKSNPIQGKNVQGNTAMGSGSLINGYV